MADEDVTWEDSTSGISVTGFIVGLGIFLLPQYPVLMNLKTNSYFDWWEEISNCLLLKKTKNMGRSE